MNFTKSDGFTPGPRDNEAHRAAVREFALALIEDAGGDPASVDALTDWLLETRVFSPEPWPVREVAS
jgi:hypothetical protein